jgi:hypothetical protein
LNISARRRRSPTGRCRLTGGDLLLGAGDSSAIVTLVERSSRYVMLWQLPDTRDSGTVVSTLSTLSC